MQELTDCQPTACQETEMNLIGACLRDPELTPFASEYVDAEDFSDGIFSGAWKHVSDCFTQNRTPSAIQLDQEFNLGDYFGMLARSSSLYEQEGIKHAAMLVNDFALRRRIANICERGLEQAANDHLTCQASDIVSEISGKLTNVKGSSTTAISAGDVAMEIAEAMENESSLDVFSTGIPELDRMFEGGIYSSKFYGFAARQKHGKTTTFSTLSYNLAQQKVPHLYLTMEGATKEIVETMIARFIGVNRINFLKSDFRKSQRAIEGVMAAKKFLDESGLLMDKKPGITFSQLKNIIGRAAIRGEIKGVFVDYIQLVKPDYDFKGTQAQHYDEVAQYLADAVKMFDIWILGAAQLNREGEIRGGDGVLNACDMTIYQHKLDQKHWIDGYNGEHETLWLEMRASRYTPYRSLGSKDEPGAFFVKKSGPYIETIPNVFAQ
jgi:replicative DNA helicase